MKESDIRKWHRQAGIFFVLFIFLQAGTGLVLTVGHISVPHSHAHGNDNDIAHTEDSQEMDTSMPHDHNAYQATGAGVEDHPAEDTAMNEHSDHDHSTGHAEVGAHWSEFIIQALHHGGGTLGIIYHIIAGAGMLFMVVTGSMIFFKIKKRERK